MMAFNFEEVQFIDQINKDIVFGYIRIAQKLLPSNNPYYNIPTLVLHACLLYYVPKECFDQIGAEMKIMYDDNDNNNNIVELKSGSVWNTAYGSFVIDANKNCNAIYQWKIKLIKLHTYSHGQSLSHGYYCGIGIDSSSIAHTKSAVFWNFDSADSCYCIRGGQSEDDGSNDKVHWSDQMWKEDDIVTLNVDTMNRTIAYGINDKEVQTVFTQIDIEAKYKFAVCVSGHHIIQINDFKIFCSKQS
eukprot:3161_1